MGLTSDQYLLKQKIKLSPAGPPVMLELYSCAVGGGVDIDHNVVLLHLRSLWCAIRAWKNWSQKIEEKIDHLDCQDKDPGNEEQQHGKG